MRAKIVPFCQLFNPPHLSATARLCARAQTALPNPARGVISQCDIAVQGAFDIVAFACSKTAPKFRPKNASRYTNPVQRWPKTRTKIDHPGSRLAPSWPLLLLAVLNSRFQRVQKSFQNRGPKTHPGVPTV